MYTPYVRGKQFELLGLREITPNIISDNKNKVSPIIEPIKFSTTLIKTLKEFASFDINFTIIINPFEGDLKNDTNTILSNIKEILPSYTNFQLGIINNIGVDHQHISNLIIDNELDDIELTFIHNIVDINIVNNINMYNNSIKYNVINQEFVNPRYKRNFIKESLILFGDHFQSQDTNREYLDYPESDFSDDIFYYDTEGFIGFGDFGTIGSKYSDKGFLPYAVAIHLSFFNEQESMIKVRHFTSDSNDDQYDVAGKFIEALEKLNTWVTTYIEEEDRTLGMNKFLNLFEEAHFPGLGTVKKLSLINHIEIVTKNLE